MSDNNAMVDEKDESLPKRFSLKDVSGTTIAVTSLAVLSAAAVLTTPVWLWYRRKRKRTDALLRRGSAPTAVEQTPSIESAEAPPASDPAPGSRS